MNEATAIARKIEEDLRKKNLLKTTEQNESKENNVEASDTGISCSNSKTPSTTVQTRRPQGPRTPPLDSMPSSASSAPVQMPHENAGMFSSAYQYPVPPFYDYLFPPVCSNPVPPPYLWQPNPAVNPNHHVSCSMFHVPMLHVSNAVPNVPQVPQAPMLVKPETEEDILRKYYLNMTVEERRQHMTVIQSNLEKLIRIDRQLKKQERAKRQPKPPPPPPPPRRKNFYRVRNPNADSMSEKYYFFKKSDSSEVLWDLPAGEDFEDFEPDALPDVEVRSTASSLQSKSRTSAQVTSSQHMIGSSASTSSCAGHSINTRKRPLKNFGGSIEEALKPVVRNYLVKMNFTDEERGSWLLKQIAKEMYKRETQRPDCRNEVTDEVRMRIVDYATKFLERKCIGDANELFKGYTSSVQ